MGEHKGWFVRLDKDSGSYRGSVSIPKTGRYRTRSFTQEEGGEKAARKWAKEEAAKNAAGLPSVLSGPKRALVADLRKSYEASLAARGRSKSHLANISNTLDAVAQVAPDLAAEGASAAIEKWLDSVKVAPSTRNRFLVEVRALVRWAMRRDLLAKDPTRVIDRAATSSVLREQFTVAELVQVLAMPTPDPPMHRRFALMALAGLRADEAAALTWADVDLAGGVILIRAHAGFRLKRGRERIVPLQPLLRSILGDPGSLPAFPAYEGEYAEAATNYAADVEAALASGRLAPLVNKNIRKHFPAFLQRCGLDPRGRSAHSCRHSYGAVMTATGVPSLLLQAYMGHSAVSTTAEYTKMASLHVQAVEGWPRGELRFGAA